MYINHIRDWTLLRRSKTYCIAGFIEVPAKSYGTKLVILAVLLSVVPLMQKALENVNFESDVMCSFLVPNLVTV